MINWISVKERLPEKWQNVIIFVEQKHLPPHIISATFTGLTYNREDPKPMWWRPGWSEDSIDITEWWAECNFPDKDGCQNSDRTKK